MCMPVCMLACIWMCVTKVYHMYRHKVENTKQSTRDIINIIWLELFIVLQATNQSIDRQSIIESIYMCTMYIQCGFYVFISDSEFNRLSLFLSLSPFRSLFIYVSSWVFFTQIQVSKHHIFHSILSRSFS